MARKYFRARSMRASSMGIARKRSRVLRALHTSGYSMYPFPNVSTSLSAYSIAQIAVSVEPADGERKRKSPFARDGPDH